MNTKINFQDIAINYLHQEQLIKYEQLTHLLNKQESIARLQTLQTQKVVKYLFTKILKTISEKGYRLQLGNNPKGDFVQIPYELFAQLNAEQGDCMQIFYTIDNVDFEQNFVLIYAHTIKTLAMHLLEKWQEKIISGDL
ncbi:MAG: hypothetical protein EAZ55_06810 [Cytophagales bacterium]|nr:MAG: hypothetical protein EAZ55_06810 [Cytophagales bacterium]